MMPNDDPVAQPFTYAIGDLHGCLGLLQQMLEILPYTPNDTLVFMGDYMDRGEDSIGTIQALRHLGMRHPHCVFLRGNHDDAWLSQWNGDRFVRPPDMDGAEEVWDMWEGKIPTEVGDFLEGTRIDFEDPYAFYVHAALKPGQSFFRTGGLVKIWGAREFVKSTYDWGKPVVFGHTKFRQPLITPNKIGIDTGAYETGILSAIRLPDFAVFQAHR